MGVKVFEMSPERGRSRRKVYEKKRTDGVFMWRFKQVWSSFWRKDQGLGMIEAAILLPLFLIITFGVMEFGNMYMNRYQVHDVAGAVADYLQANPGATMDTPNGGLTMFVENLGVGLKNTTSGGENQISSKIKIKSATSIQTEAQFNALCSGGDVQSWGNPHLLDADVTNDQNPYYIHVCYPYTYNNITPLSGLSGGLLSGTKTLKGKAIAYVNTNNGGGGGKNGNDGNTPTIANIKCATGQVVVGIYNGSPLCEDLVADGGGVGSGECSRIPGARLSDGSIVADRCSPMVTTAESYLAHDGFFGNGLFFFGGTGVKEGLPVTLPSAWIPLSREMTVPNHPSIYSPNTVDLEETSGALVRLPSGKASCISQECVDGLETLFSSPGKFCENLTAHGRSDWVLPTAAELYVLYNNRKAIGAMSPPKTTKDNYLNTALFFADSRDDSTKAERVADALISFGTTTSPVKTGGFQGDHFDNHANALYNTNNKFKKGGQMIFRPKDVHGTNTPYAWYTQRFWWKNLFSTPNPQLSSLSISHHVDGDVGSAYFGVRCVRQSDQ